MPIPVTCECGKTYNVKEELAGKTVRCKQCGDLLRIPTEDDMKELVKESGQYLTQTKTTEEATIRCANCGRSMPKTLEKCRHCGKMLRKSMKRTLVIIAAGGVLALLFILVLIVFLVPSKKDIIGQRAAELVDNLKQKAWDGVYELDRVRVQGVNSAEYIEDREKLFADLEFTDVSLGEIKIDTDIDSVTTKIDITAKHKTAKKSKQWDFNVEWREENGMWLALLGQAKILNKIREYVKASEIKPEVICDVCKATGRTTCPSCGGEGKLGDGSYCRDCYLSQGWQVCNICKGTGKKILEEK